jgi:4-amino-4-deoxy-L-arabinose transferase-like glycosyltransferase
MPTSRLPAAVQRLQRSTAHALAAHQRTLLFVLLLIAGTLRGLLVAFSPTPFGYVWDFYGEGVRLVFDTGHLPASTACWQCYHPPLFYLLGWPLYAFGRWSAAGFPGNDVQAQRWLAGLAIPSAAMTVYYGYRLLRLFRCRGGSLLTGVALLVTFPCLFISSYGAEADIVLTGILSAFIYYLTRHFAMSGSVPSALRLGVLAGLAAATKYSGLIAVASAAIVLGIRAIFGPRRVAAMRDTLLVIGVCGVVGGWKYVDNYRHYGTLLYANGTAAQGFGITDGPQLRGQYEFTTLRLSALMRMVSPRAGRGQLTDFPVYQSVPTTLHALAWSDMSFFSEPTRHGDPGHPYPRKRVSVGLIRTVLVLGFVPELLAIVGFTVTLRRRILWPLTVVCAVAMSAYTWWFISQEAWGLKTKYVLFLLPPFVVYAVSGLAWLWKHAPFVSVVAGALVAALVLVTHYYLLAFAVG